MLLRRLVLPLLWLATLPLAAQAPAWEQIPESARWELQMLGVTDAARLAQVRSLVGDRVVTLALVGEGGVSESELTPLLPARSSFFYRAWPAGQDPNCPGSHDSAQAVIFLDLLRALGVRLRLVSYQAEDSYESVAQQFAAAGDRADLVVCYHSFWGDVGVILDSVAAHSRALSLWPYGETEGRPTSTSTQAASAKPWGGGLPHMLNCAPLAHNSDGSLVSPANRDAADTEIINLVAPSFYANGPGGTCCAVGVVAAVAAYAVAAAPQRPTALALAEWLRRSATVDEAALTCAPPFTAEHLQRLRESLASLTQPGPGGPGKLDAVGVISLYGLYGQLVAGGGA